MKFINPYNFISFNEKEIERNHSIKKANDILELKKENPDKLISGQILYEINTLTPVFIPNVSYDNAFQMDSDGNENKHKSYDFFSYTQLEMGKNYTNEYHEPVIPGSEVRGMVRSIFEALTDSCISAVNDDEVLSKRTPEQFEPGILKKTKQGYELYQATDYIHRAVDNNGKPDFTKKIYKSKTMENIKDGSLVYFEKEKNNRLKYEKPIAINIMQKENNLKKSGMLTGYIVKGNDGPEIEKNKKSKCRECPAYTKNKCDKEEIKHCYLAEKHCVHIFEKKDEKKSYLNTEYVNYQLDNILKIYDNNQKNVYKEYSESWNKVKNDKECGGEIPVYYSKIDKNIIYLSPACIGREIYNKKVSDIISNYRSCDDANKLCEACSLFGTVNDNIKVSSKLRFADLKVDSLKEDNNYKKYYEDIITVPELSNPNLSSTEMYLEKPEDSEGQVLNWTYDYYVVLCNDNSVKVKKYPNGPKLAGRKFYWNDVTGIDLWKNVEIEKTERNKTIRPLKKNIKFNGKIFFENITDEQLNKFLCVLKIPENPQYAYKLGNGKPVGFGSIGIQVKKVEVRKLSVKDGKIEYDLSEEKFNEENLETFIKKHEKELIMFKYESLSEDEKIHYPAITFNHNEEGFNWFVNNRIAYEMGRKDKKLNLDEIDSYPRTRNQIKYNKYLKSGEKIMCENARNNSIQENNNIINSTDSKDIVNGIVNGFNKNKTAVNVIVDGRKIQILYKNVKYKNIERDQMENEFNIGDSLQVKYEGKEDNGFEKWICISKN